MDDCRVPFYDSLAFLEEILAITEWSGPNLITFLASVVNVIIDSGSGCFGERTYEKHRMLLSKTSTTVDRAARSKV